MGNKMKKLICALLASAMLVSSVGMAAFADETTTSEQTTTTTEAAEAEATAAPEETTDAEATADPEATEAPAETADPDATEAPEATEAPAATEAVATEAPSSSVYDSDKYYQKALKLCSALGIISGYEDGSIQPESKVTRAEMASIVLRMLAITSWSPYQNGFTDVTSDHWAATQIQSAQEASIVSGMGDGTFQPDGNVTYAQVMVMLVNALNYKTDAEYYGGWQQGYVKVAGSELDLLKNAESSNDEPADRGLVIKMVYNALLADYRQVTGYEDGYPVYSVKENEETLIEAKFNVKEEKGVLIATSKTSSDASISVQSGEIAITKTDESSPDTYTTELTDIEDMLSQKVIFYYKEVSGKTDEVVAIVLDSSKSSSDEYDAEDIESVTGFDEGEGQIKIDGVSKKKSFSEDVSIIYNGDTITLADYESAKAAASTAGEKVRFGGDDGTFNDFLKPEYGSIKMVDSDNDDKYDTLFVDSYETLIVSSATADRLVGNIYDPDTNSKVSLSLKLDSDDEDITVTVKRAGADVKLRNLKKNDVASMKRSIDNSVVDIVVTGESVTGTASGFSSKIDNAYVKIDGTKYEVANIAIDDVKTGSDSVFYLDSFGRIAYVESSTGGLLDTGEKYGWIVNGYTSEDGQNYLVQVFSQDGKTYDYKLAENVSYWGPDSTESTSYKKAEAAEAVEAVISGSKYLKTSNSNQIRLIKYKANSSNALTEIYFAQAKSDELEDTDALIIDTQDLNSKPVQASLVYGYRINDGITEFSVPKNASDMTNSNNYSIGTVTSSVYVVRENGSSRNYVVGEFEDTNVATILINFTSSADAVASLEDIDTNANNPVMVVDEIARGVDDDDNVVYTVSGYVSGAEASFTTTKNSILGELNTSSAIINSARDYNTTKLWDAQSGGSDGDDLSDYLAEGDLVLYDTGERLIRLMDADDMYNVVVNGASSSGLVFGSFSPFVARNMFSCGALEDSDLSDVARITIDTSSLNTIQFDTSKLMDTIDIDITTGKASIDTDCSEIGDLITYDPESKTGDYIFARFADKGTIQEIIVYRFED